MEANKTDLSNHFDACLRDCKRFKFNTKKDFLNNLGYTFHKLLRQMDVTKSGGGTDMKIWHYLSQDDCVFWEAYRRISIRDVKLKRKG
jgi:hypothetical protein